MHILLVDVESDWLLNKIYIFLPHESQPDVMCNPAYTYSNELDPRDQLSRNQLPLNQLPIDQLPTWSTPIKSTSHEINC